MIYVHLTVRVQLGSPSLCEAGIAVALWSALRRAFPNALACVLMPDHIHLITAAMSAASARRQLALTLGGLRRSAGAVARVGWERVPLPVVIPDRKHLARQVRYVALNPCRAGLVGCPLAWRWSTHRDVLGAVFDPWVSEARLARALGARRAGFALAHHRDVSADPTANVVGTAAPRAAAPTEVTREPLAAIAAATLAALRAHPADLRRAGGTRDLFIALARRQGWTSTRLLAGVTGLSARSVRRRPRQHAALAAAALCLGDPRLHDAEDVLWSRQQCSDRCARLTERRSQEAHVADMGAP